MYTKTEIYNLALNALLLNKQITNPDTDTSSENRTLNTNFNTAFYSALEDMNLNRTRTRVQLELIESEPNDEWAYAYKYPTRCAFLRRIVSGQIKDNEASRIPLETGMHEGQFVIFTNLADAEADIIDKNISLAGLSSNAALAIAHKLAWLSAPLIVGKNTTGLKKSILEQYDYFKLEAQRMDYMENFNYETPEEQSSWLRARME